jgi:SAM-dependent methyltransferase
MQAPLPDWQLPFGVNRGLWDYLRDEEMPRAYDAGLAESSLARADIRFAERHFDRSGRLIDLGCGTGRLLIPFARRGYSVVGVDLSAGMLRAVADKARAANVSVECIRANIVELDCLVAQSFDYAACLFSTLGMVNGAKARSQAAQQVYRLLRPGGRFVLHTHNYWFNLWNASGRKWLATDLWRRIRKSESIGDCLMPVHQGIAGLSLHLFRKNEAIGLLKDAGFSIVEIVPVSLAQDSRLKWPWWLGSLRAYGYLIAAERPR